MCRSKGKSGQDAWDLGIRRKSCSQAFLRLCSKAKNVFFYTYRLLSIETSHTALIFGSGRFCLWRGPQVQTSVRGAARRQRA